MNYSDEKLRIFLKYTELLRTTKKNDQHYSEFSRMTEKTNITIPTFPESTRIFTNYPENT